MNFLRPLSLDKPSQYSTSFLRSEITTALRGAPGAGGGRAAAERSAGMVVATAMALVVLAARGGGWCAPIVFEPLALLDVDLEPERHVLKHVVLAARLGLERHEALGQLDGHILRFDGLECDEDLLEPLRPDQVGRRHCGRGRHSGGARR